MTEIKIKKGIKPMKRTLIEKIINVEILTLANELAEYLLNDTNTYYWDEGINFYTEFEGAVNKDNKPKTDCNCYNCDVVGVVDAHTDNCINCFEPEPKEVLQWFIVSDWLYNKLKEQGEPVIEMKGVNFWGRCGCGYSLEDEWCLKRIVSELEQPLKTA